MHYNPNIREEELKNKVRDDFFHDFDATNQLGNVDFAVCRRRPSPELFEQEYLLWAEAKKGTTADIYESFVQLILTIGRERTADRYLPPTFLGAFDAARIAFLPYHLVMDVFTMNDFNWNVTPSDHATAEFQLLHRRLSETLRHDVLIFRFETEEREIRQFIAQNFREGLTDTRRIRINKNNFTHIYQKWREAVKPTIDIQWDVAKSAGLLEADFYLADILSQHNTTLMQRLHVLLQEKRYVFDRKINAYGATTESSAEFKDGQAAHTLFWNRYERPPRREYWDYIALRRDLLVPQDVRERKGSYFTPRQWVELSQQYIAAELGEDWQTNYYVWDCCAGTGNLLAGLTEPYNVYASTLDQADVDVMKERIQAGAKLLPDHVFQFDFLNDSFDKLPASLRDIINDPAKRCRLVVYINPPYAEAGNAKQSVGTGKNKSKVATTTKVYNNALYRKLYGKGLVELYAQFFVRIYHEVPNCVLAEFSTLKILQAPNFQDFRTNFRAKLGRFFLVPANTFDNVKGKFPIGFFIWRTDVEETFHSAVADVYDSKGNYTGQKHIYCEDRDRLIGRWLATFKEPADTYLGELNSGRNDFQNTKYCNIANEIGEQSHALVLKMTPRNLLPACIYYSVRHVIPATWLNDRDQFLYPQDGWQEDWEFQTDCLVYTLFNNNIQHRYGTNHWIPFDEAEVGARDRYESRFMTDFLHGRLKPEPKQPADLFDEAPADGEQPYVPLQHLSAEAQDVMTAAREVYRYYHQQPTADANASYYDIRAHFQGRNEKGNMNPDSPDARYTALRAALSDALRRLAAHIAPKVYRYGFLRE